MKVRMVALVAAMLLTGCGSGGGLVVGGDKAPHPTTTTLTTLVPRLTPAPWDRPQDQDAAVRAAGLVLSTSETLTVHYHSHLDVIIDGKSTPVPGGLGINQNADGSLPPHGSPGIASLHTHSADGVLHVEAPAAATFTLGQVFAEWNVALDRGRVGSYSTSKGDAVAVLTNGVRYLGDPRTVVLKSLQSVVVLVTTKGHRPVVPPQRYGFAKHGITS